MKKSLNKFHEVDSTVNKEPCVHSENYPIESDSFNPQNDWTKDAPILGDAGEVKIKPEATDDPTVSKPSNNKNKLNISSKTKPEKNKEIKGESDV